MHRMILYEIKKIFTQKFVRILFVLLILGNIVICIAIAVQDNNKIPDKYWKSIMDMYKISPQAVEEINNSLYEEISEQIEAHIYAIENNMTELPIIMQFNYINYKNFTDFDLFNSFIQYRDNVENYQENLQIYINQAIRRKKDIEDLANNNSFIYDYQNKIILLYTKLSDEVNIEFDYVYGWDRLFNYAGTMLFGFIAVLIVGCLSFSYDKYCGIEKIIKTTKKGKYSIIWAKIISVIILSAMISMIFSILSFITIGIFRGYSNPLNAIQLLSDYLLCPFNITFIGAYIMTSLLRVASCIVLGLFVTFISIFLNKYSVTLFGGAILIWLNYRISIINTSSQYKHLNLLSISSAHDMLSRYRAVSVLDNVVDFFVILVFSMTILTLICIVGIVFISSSNRFSINIKMSYLDDILKYLKIFKLKIMNSTILYKHNNVRKYPKYLLSWEFSKNKILVFISLFLVLIKIYTIYDEYSYKKSYTDDIYKDYMTYLAGPLTDEKLEYINKEFEYINRINNGMSGMIKNYMSGRITFDEYEAYVEEYKYTQARKDIILQIKQHGEYLFEIKEIHGIDAYFIYDTGVLKIIERDFDIFLYIIIVLFAGGLFIKEFNNKDTFLCFANMLRTMKNGRHKTFFTKSILAIFISLCFYIIITIIDFASVFFNYMIPNLDAPLISLRNYENIASDILIIEYLILTIFVSISAVLILSIIAISISQLLKNPISVYTVILLSTFTPYALTTLNVPLFQYFDFTHFMGADSLVKLSIDTNILGKYGYMFIFLLIIIGISIYLYKLSYKNYCIK